MLFVLHGCKESNPKIQLFVNEGLVKLPWCSSTLCPLSEFEDYMHSLCDECTHAAWHSTCTQIRYTSFPGGAGAINLLAVLLSCSAGQLLARAVLNLLLAAAAIYHNAGASILDI